METKTSQTPVGKKLLKLCESEGITLNELANKVGVTSSTVYAIITGHTKNPRFDFLLAVCEKFDLNANWMLRDFGPMRGEEKETQYVQNNQESHFNDNGLTEYLKSENAYLRERLSDVIGKLGKSRAFRMQAGNFNPGLNASLYQ